MRINYKERISFQGVSRSGHTIRSKTGRCCPSFDLGSDDQLIAKAASCDLRPLHSVMLDITRNGWHYTSVEIESINHKALRKLVEKGSTKGVIEAERVIDMIALIVAAASFDELDTPPNYGFHELKGDRKGTFAMTVTRNWRLTFTKADDQTVADLDLEDYH